MIVKLVAANMMLSMLNIIRVNCDVDCDVHCHGNDGEIIAVKKRPIAAKDATITQTGGKS